MDGLIEEVASKTHGSLPGEGGNELRVTVDGLIGEAMSVLPWSLLGKGDNELRVDGLLVIEEVTSVDSVPPLLLVREGDHESCVDGLIEGVTSGVPGSQLKMILSVPL